MRVKRDRSATQLVPVVPELLAKHVKPLGAFERLAAIDQLIRQAGHDEAMRILREATDILDEA